MPTAKVAITLDEDLLRDLDAEVAAGAFPNRSKAIAAAVREKLERLHGGRLARESAKLDPGFEQAMAEEGLSGDASAWPTF